jgi:purine-binding chemotaxis protein CheW
VHYVAETMRPLPVAPVLGTPEYVRGLSVIRGAPVPVVDLPALLDCRASGTSSTGRFVTVKAGDRRFALAVDSVIGIRELDATQLEELPPLLRHADVDLIEAIGVADAQLLVVLRGARILSEEAWQAIEAGRVIR